MIKIDQFLKLNFNSEIYLIPEICLLKNFLYVFFQETMKMHVLDRTVNWSAHTPYFLFKSGAMQGWVDMYKAVAAKDYDGGRFIFNSTAFVSDLFEDPKQPEIPAAPALEFKLELDGTATPSIQNASVLPKHLQTNKSAQWDNDLVRDMVKAPVSDLNAPNMGEFNNLLPPMYLDYNPEIKK